MCWVSRDLNPVFYPGSDPTEEISTFFDTFVQFVKKRVERAKPIQKIDSYWESTHALSNDTT